MPRVPSNYGELPNQFNPPAAQPASPRTIPGEQLQRFGQATMRVGATAAAIDADQLQRANQLRVDDALNQVREASMRLTYDPEVGYTNIKGRDALERPDGRPLNVEYSQQLEKSINATSSNLSNPAQKLVFKQNAGELLRRFREDAMRHQTREFTTYHTSVRQGTIKLAMDQIGLNYNNPLKIDESVTSIRAAALDLAHMQGKSATEAEADAKALVSNAHRVALSAAFENNDVLFAESYLRKYGPQMNADDLMRARGLITKEVNEQVGVGIATEVLDESLAAVAGTDFERAFKILIGTESNGRQLDDNGRPLTSSAGAIGIAQVMPGTGPEAAKMAGLEWDDNRYRTDPEYNAALGRAYFEKQVRDNDGDLAKAFAAYNAGPGKLKAAVERADKVNRLAANDPAVQPVSWLNFMPKETRDYVAKNMGAFEKGRSSARSPLVTLDQLKTELRQRAELVGNHDRLAAAEAELESRYKDKLAAMKQIEDAAVATAYKTLLANGGDFYGMDARTKAMIPVMRVDEVMTFAKKIRDGNDTTDMRVYARLESNPRMLATMSDDEFVSLRRYLSESDHKYFAKERAKLLTGRSANAADEMNSSAVKSSVDTRLHMFGIDPTPKDGSSDAERVGAIRKFINDYIFVAQREAGKKFTDAEVSQHVDALFMKSVNTRRDVLRPYTQGWGSYWMGGPRPMLSMEAGDIPGEYEQAIQDAYREQGVPNPTDAQILHMYWMMQTAQR